MDTGSKNNGIGKVYGIVTAVFFALEAALYCGFMALDIAGGHSGISGGLKFAAIMGCMIAAYVYAVFEGTRTARLTAAALTFTVYSDSRLLFSDNYLFGVLSFCVVQTLYLVMLAYEYGGTKKRGSSPIRIIAVSLAIRAVLAAAAGFALRSLAGEDALLIGFTAFYGISFVGNIIFAAAVAAGTRHTEERRGGGLRPGLFLAGLIVFALCDFNVLLYNLPAYIDISSEVLLFLLRFAGDFMWMFYLPSQVMIVMSGRGRK